MEDSHESKSVYKTLLEHIEDLRWTLIKSGATLVGAMVVCFIFRGTLAAWMEKPLLMAAPEQASRLQSLGVADSFTVSLELAFYAGLVLAFPIIVFFVGQFAMPALTLIERRVVLPVVVIGFGLFLVGVVFAYLVILPITLAFFLADATQTMGWTPFWTVREYYTFSSTLVMSFGLSFQLPLVIIALVKLGFVNHAMLARTRPYAVVIIAVFSAVMTPPDILTLALMGLPMYVLYEICILIAWFLRRKEEIKSI